MSASAIGAIARGDTYQNISGPRTHVGPGNWHSPLTLPTTHAQGDDE